MVSFTYANGKVKKLQVKTGKKQRIRMVDHAY